MTGVRQGVFRLLGQKLWHFLEVSTRFSAACDGGRIEMDLTPKCSFPSTCGSS